MHVATLLQVRPVSSPAQYCVPSTSSHRVPAKQSPFEEHGRVQRFSPNRTSALHTSGDAQLASEAQRSSSCPTPPLDDVEDDELDGPLDVDEVDDEPEGPLDDEGSPPAPPVPPLDELPGPDEMGSHCALTLQVWPAGQSRVESTQSCLQVPLSQYALTQSLLNLQGISRAQPA